ncbi:hypothetical protein GCM10022248_06960 [Nonomuraea soli]
MPAGGSEGSHAKPSPRLTDRMVKYIANSAAKNMSSEDSHTIVPTLTRFGLRDECAVVEVIADAVATGSIIAVPMVGSLLDPPIVASEVAPSRDNGNKSPTGTATLGIRPGTPVRS